MRDPLVNFWAQAKKIHLSPKQMAEGRATFASTMQLSQTASKLLLTRKERAAGLQELAEALTDRPIVVETLWDKFVEAAHTAWFRVPVTALCLFVVGGGALGAAAENAMPGDALYSFKVSISEPLMNVFHLRQRSSAGTPSAARKEMMLMDAKEAIATTPDAKRIADPAATDLRQQTSEFLNAIDKALPGEENKDLRHQAVLMFEARANHVTANTRVDLSGHDIIRAALDEQSRIENALNASARVKIAPPGSVITSSSSIKGPSRTASAALLRLQKRLKK